MGHLTFWCVGLYIDKCINAARYLVAFVDFMMLVEFNMNTITILPGGKGHAGRHYIPGVIRRERQFS